jgi:hypothetical protein
MLRAQEQPFAGGNEAAVRKKRLGDFSPMDQSPTTILTIDRQALRVIF